MEDLLNLERYALDRIKNSPYHQLQLPLENPYPKGAAQNDNDCPIKLTEIAISVEDKHNMADKLA